MSAPKSKRRSGKKWTLGTTGAGGMSFEHRGVYLGRFTDVYHHLLTITWTRTFGFMAVSFTIFNLVFGALYLLGGDCINASNPHSFPLAFSFSVQTMAAVGYGAMSPTTPWAYFLSDLEGFLGLICMAMASGLMFAKFSRPTSRITFSDSIVVNDRDGVPTLQFRMSNERGNQIVEAQLSVVALVDTVTREGDKMRSLIDLSLVRSRTPMFSMSWVALHPLDEHSPLTPLISPDGCDAKLLLIIANLTGMDDTFNQTVHAQQGYRPEMVRWGHRFIDMIENSGHHIIVHHKRIHDVEPI